MTGDPTASLAALQRRFLSRCGADLDRLSAWAADDAPPSADLAFVVHRLAGAAGTFGYDRVSAAAAELEAGLAEPGPPSASLLPLIAELKAMLEAAAAD